MSTTTAPAKPKAPPSISAQLEKLEQRRKAAHAKAREARARVAAYDAETEEMRGAYTVALGEHPEQRSEGPNPHPLPGTELARMRDEVRKRMTEPNPRLPAYGRHRDAFHEVAEACDQFKRAHVVDRLADLDPAQQAGEDEIREGFAAVVRGCERLQAVANGAREIALDTPGLDGQAIGYDGRPNEWKQMALDALESEIAKPGLTPNAAHKVGA